MSKELTKEQCGAIIYCRQRDDSYRTIATTVGCGVTTVFDTLKTMKHPSNIAELDRCVKKAWQEIPIHTIENLINSILQRI